MSNNTNHKNNDPEPHFSIDKEISDVEVPTDEEFVQNSIDLMMSGGMSNEEAITRLKHALEVAPDNLKEITKRKIEELKVEL